MNSEFRRHLIAKRKKAISEVVGAMLLLIVVVVAVGTFAYYLNNIQNAAQNRNQFLQNISNDKLQITNLQFLLNSPLVQYEIFNPLNPSFRFWIQFVSPTTVELINVTTGKLANLANLNSSDVNPPMAGMFTQAYYNSINFSTTANLYHSRALWNITFIPPTLGQPPGNCTFRTATWSNATIYVRNLNTLASGLRAIQVNGNWIGSTRGNYWFPVNQEGQITDFVNDTTKLIGYNATGPTVSLPARSSVNLMLNLSSLTIPRNDSLQIVLLSTYGNYFTTSYGVPEAFIQQTVNTENILVGTVDVPTFDATLSKATNGSFIQSYFWSIDVPKTGWSIGDWTNVAHIATVYVGGQILQYRPSSFFRSTSGCQWN